MNHHIRTVIIAPMTSKRRAYPTRVSCNFSGKEGQIVLDQIRSVDQARLIKKLGIMDTKVQKLVCKILIEMFS